MINTDPIVAAVRSFCPVAKGYRVSIFAFSAGVFHIEKPHFLFSFTVVELEIDSLEEPDAILEDTAMVSARFTLPESSRLMPWKAPSAPNG
jgi:hypothetical protein